MEIFLVQCEYLHKPSGVTETSQAGFSYDYETAKNRLHECIKEEMGEGNIPQDYNGWTNPPYEDEFLYENEESRLLYYVCTVDEI